jgi:hypothetical protein
LVNIINIDIITSITTTTTNRNLPRPGKATEKGPENTMDSTLIHLLPNCFPSSFGHHPRLPSTTSPTSEQQQPPPPPYTLNPPTIHPTPPINIPLTISLLGPPARCSKSRPLLYCLQDHLELSPETTYQELIDGLRIRLAKLGVNSDESDKGSSWNVGISAMGRSRSRVFGRRVLWGGYLEMEVGRETWGDVMKGFGEGRFECLRVDCWRE